MSTFFVSSLVIIILWIFDVLTTRLTRIIGFKDESFAVGAANLLRRSKVGSANARNTNGNQTRSSANRRVPTSRRANLRGLALLNRQFAIKITPRLHARVNLHEQESLLVVIGEQVDLELSKREVNVLVLVVRDREFDTNADHPWRLALGHDLENSGRLALFLDPRSVDDVICGEFRACLLCHLLQLRNPVARIADLRVLRCAPQLLWGTQVEHTLRVRVHVLATDLLKGDSGHLRVFLQNDTGRLIKQLTHNVGGWVAWKHV